MDGKHFIGKSEFLIVEYRILGSIWGLMPSLSSRIFYIRRDTYYSPGRNLRVHFHLRLCLDQGLASGQRAWLSRSSHLHHHSSLPHPLRSIHSNLVPF